MVHKLAPIHQGQGKTEEANHSWLVGSSFKSKKLKRFALGKKKKKKKKKMRRPPHQPTDLKVSVEALNGA